MLGHKGYFDARALAVDYRTLGFRECVGEVVRYLSCLDAESTDPIAARLVSHLSHCASELDPLHLQSPPASVLAFPPWPWASFPQIAPTSQASPSPPFPGGRRDLALLGSFPSPATLRCGQALPGLVPPAALASVHRVPALAASPALGPSRPNQPSPHSATRASPHSLLSSSSPSTSSSSSPSDLLQVSFRPFAPLAQRRGVSNRAAKPVQGWGTEIGAF